MGSPVAVLVQPCFLSWTKPEVQNQTRSPETKAKSRGDGRVCPWIVGACSGHKPKLAVTGTALGWAFWNPVLQVLVKWAFDFQTRGLSFQSRSSGSCIFHKDKRIQIENSLFLLKSINNKVYSNKINIKVIKSISNNGHPGRYRCFSLAGSVKNISL